MPITNTTRNTTRNSYIARLRAALYTYDIAAYGWHLRHPRSMCNVPFWRGVLATALDILGDMHPRTRKYTDRFLPNG